MIYYNDYKLAYNICSINTRNTVKNRFRLFTNALPDSYPIYWFESTIPKSFIVLFSWLKSRYDTIDLAPINDSKTLLLKSINEKFSSVNLNPMMYFLTYSEIYPSWNSKNCHIFIWLNIIHNTVIEDKFSAFIVIVVAKTAPTIVYEAVE